MAATDWVRGDLLGCDVPLHVEALRAAGPDYLTEAFRAVGSLGGDNRVAEVTRLEAFRGGSTGRKAVLAVGYEHPDPHLPEQLFVKFSRDFDDQLRDRGKRQMESEVRFGLLSQIPDFPVAVPRCLFGDYHLESGSGILVSERIVFGQDGVEPRRQFALQMVSGGLQWPLGAVPLLERHVPDLAEVRDRFDPLIREDEFARTQLHLLTGTLMLWRSFDPGSVIDRAVRAARHGRADAATSGAS